MRNITSLTYKSIAALLAIVVVMMILFPSLSAVENESSFTGIQITFGYEFLSLGSLASGEIVFSFLNMVAYFLPVLVVFSLVFSKHGLILSTVLFLITTILLISIPELTVVTVTILESVNEVNVDWAFGYGLIVAITASIAGLFVSSVSVIQKRT